MNDQIRVSEVRLIDGEGEQVGIISTDAALEMALSYNLDLVEVSPKAKPPVCRLMDYGKFKYQQSKRSHIAKQNQKVVHLKEVKMKPKIEEHDFQFKLRNALRFLEDGDKVKVGVRFMGRQIAHKDLGVELLEKFQAEIGEDGSVEQPIRSEGRSMHMIIAPPKKRK
ncbi:MAG: translation initiation factor IF-3 [SAR324 cluster bacterium]|nr:translation initiation factor IF-3 [SAR324 cluster bacterium]